MFQQCNRSELYQLCRKAEIHVPADASREDMIRLLEGEEATLPPNTIDEYRDAIMRFLLEHWTVVASQLTCPAKSGDPRSCYQCVDAQVLACIVQQNEHDQKLIALRRSK